MGGRRFEIAAIRLFLKSETYQMLINPELEIYKMSKEADFFIYLIERYAEAKKTTAQHIIKQWDSLNLTEFIYEMYEIYHIERLENAFEDIDKLIIEKQG